MARFLARTIMLILALALAAAVAYGLGRLARHMELGGRHSVEPQVVQAPEPAPSVTDTSQPITLPPAGTTHPLPTTQPAPADSGLVDLAAQDPSLKIELRYATTNNFTGKALYPVATAYLLPGTAKKLVAANTEFQQQGYTLKVWDAYRPLSVQKILYKASPRKGLVADPKKGSNHNRGAAVDVTLADSTGTDVEMPSDFDDATDKATTAYTGCTDTAKKNRDYLKKVMEENGFKGISTEWWHFDDPDNANKPLLDIPLDQVVPAP